MTVVDAQATARDAALDRLAVTRAARITTATSIALAIWKEKGEVSSTDVWAEIRRQAMEDQGMTWLLVDDADPRWIGAVFRRGWRRLRWEATGSHKRPVAVWTRAAEVTP